jgi:chemotaxis protein MotA
LDLATLIGQIAATVLLIWSLYMSAGGNLVAYWDQPSAMMVIGGAIFVTLSSLMLGQFLSFFKVLKNTVLNRQMSVSDVIVQMVSLSEIARRDGVLSLENRAKEISDPFLANGIRLVVDGVDAGVIESIMNSELEAIDTRHAKGKQILDLLAKYAPAFGMIGTLVGLVAMLKNMDDPKKIGPGMAVALLTTLYGAVMANVLFLPLADKLSLRNEQEMLVRTVMIKGLLSLQAGDNPRVTQAKLAAYLSRKERQELEKRTAKQ